ncbi:unnamed protein product [Citrullus colocynthis]|uniref:C2H2-type domain-containing protein n=1 Tax=Citrullus colocynthis TaxID=252529 RepID=A0ABP0Y7H1_9ROSI
MQASNLQQHMKVVHMGQKPFACCFPGCGMRFGYKHVRDNHEKSGQHVYTNGDLKQLMNNSAQNQGEGEKESVQLQHSFVTNPCPTTNMCIESFYIFVGFSDPVLLKIRLKHKFGVSDFVDDKREI